MLQMKGLLGLMEHDHNESSRHKSDALAHYIREIHWFNLIFVTAMIHVISINFNVAGINMTYDPKKVAYSSLMLVGRLL